MSRMVELLNIACERRVLRALDVQFARLIAGDERPALMLAAAWVSAGAGEGHVCLPLVHFTEQQLFAGRYPELARQIWFEAGEPDWQTLLPQEEAVGDGSGPTPLVLWQQRLYLHRMWQSEGEVAHFFAHDTPVSLQNPERLRAILDDYFGVQSDNGQKIAAAVAITRQIAVISGGPGTGKTTTVANLLASLLELSGEKLRICLAAPTGKAAARLTESLAKALKALMVSEATRQQLLTEATTLHRLLGVLPGSQRMRYHAGNPLHLDLLVVDEASMVDLPMMANLIAALPSRARVIFLGDRDQLASVEAGAVLGDICRCAEVGYSPARAQELRLLTGCDVAANDVQQAGVHDSICLLRKSFRFGASSGIGQMAQAVNAGDSHQVDRLFAAGFTDIERFSLQTGEQYQYLLGVCLAGYQEYLSLLRNKVQPEQAIEAFGRFRLLCALREGPFGVIGLNERIEAFLSRQRLIQRAPGIGGKWYAGRPVMISRNDSALGLFNGDIGITMYNDEEKLKVFFPLADGTIKAVQPVRLPPHETAFAMTVHKSQGSEFDHTLLVLPDQFTPILTRELIYTAITRARSKLTLFAEQTVFNQAVKIRTLRRSGLIARLNLSENQQ
ncbi:exodeoxyribonuclease V subunit alpha [Erwinia tracheiphila]|uniref:RecBCD enzyme subunit RecD n=1 Tax=Erwinia tracheiphila TaxID=65700 RepID=A0A0M2K8Z2_9GAMM|nr:exodeoxyribonuclease V subunit alpha [Erwinia tracheiphila]EOS95981.1 exonuclease V subunit alpha [Erwinia tracheiphila PSU-1]KKF35404.1 exonuclease V subunit alpha [Erwinia tracheiphila]UIA87063.1 exodeoxyribonuclease V subunit alpha [Erwinia tracheiphila]UIA95422.1 exodeoxyribonuclease V subunit alpha [Erwinia tracheiphila]